MTTPTLVRVPEMAAARAQDAHIPTAPSASAIVKEDLEAIDLHLMSSFGGVLHALEGKPVQSLCCGCCTERNVIILFEGGIQSQTSDTYCCGACSNTYSYVVPRHTIVGVDVDSMRARCVPCCCIRCCTRSLVHLKLKTDPEAPRSLFRQDDHMFINSSGLAAEVDHIMFDYVYASLIKSGVGTHAHHLAHLMAGGLCNKAEVSLNLMDADVMERS